MRAYAPSTKASTRRVPASTTHRASASAHSGSAANIPNLQRQVGNAAVARMLEDERDEHGPGCGRALIGPPRTVQRMPTDMEVDEEPSAVALGKRKAADDSATAKPTGSTLWQKVTADLKLGRATGLRQASWTPQVEMRYPRSYEEDRTPQTLRHIATLLFSCIQYLEKNDQRQATSKMRGDQEVQGMLIQERLVFATNLNASITLIENALQRADDKLGDLLLQDYEAMGGEESERRKRAARKVHEVYRGTRVNDAASALKNVKQIKYAEAMPKTPEGVKLLHTLLTHDDFKGAAIFLRTSGHSREVFHAEQKLAAALRNSKVTPEEITQQIPIRGQKRPCAGCRALLELMRNHGYDISFNERQGGYYQEAVESIVKYAPELVPRPGQPQHDGSHENAVPALVNLIKQQGRMHVSAKFDMEQGETPPPDSGPGFDVINSVQGDGKVGFGKHFSMIDIGNESHSESEGESTDPMTSGMARLDLTGVSADAPAPRKRRTPQEIEAEKAEVAARKAESSKTLTPTQREELMVKLAAATESSLKRRRVVYEQAVKDRRPNRRGQPPEEKVAKEKIPPELLPYLVDLITNKKVTQASIAAALDCTSSAVLKAIKKYEEKK